MLQLPLRALRRPAARDTPVLQLAPESTSSPSCSRHARVTVAPESTSSPSCSRHAPVTVAAESRWGPCGADNEYKYSIVQIWSTDRARSTQPCPRTWREARSLAHGPLNYLVDLAALDFFFSTASFGLKCMLQHRFVRFKVYASATAPAKCWFMLQQLHQPSVGLAAGFFLFFGGFWLLFCVWV